MDLDAQLKEAKADLAALTTVDLPRFEQMARERLQDETELRQQVKDGKAKLEQLVEARYKREAAESILAEHHVDIETQRAEVQRLEAEHGRERTLEKMVSLAKEAQAQRRAYDAAIVAANEVLAPLISAMVSARRGWKQARSDFVNAGRPLSKGFGRSSWGMTSGSPEDQRILEGLIRELEDRGAELDDALAPHDGRQMTMGDRDHAPPLAQPEPFGYHLAEMLKHGDLHE
jgi:phage gp36-like protein